MKWHDDNREKFERHCLLAAVSQNFQIPEEKLTPLEVEGLVEKKFYWEITAAGRQQYEIVAAEISNACEEA